MHRVATGLLVTLFITPGCGNDDGNRPKPPQRQESAVAREVRSTVSAWLRTVAGGNDARACSYLTPHLQRLIDTQLRIGGMPKETCTTFASHWTRAVAAPGHRDARVRKIVIHGRSAQATLTASPDIESKVDLRRLRGRWLIENY